MRKTTHRLALGLATAALGLTAACGGGGGDDDATGTIELTTFGEFGYDDLVKQWNEDNPDTPVKQTKVSKWDDWKNELNTMLQAGTGLPDVVAVEGDFMPAIVAAPDRWVDLASDDVKGRWLDFKEKEATTADGALLGYATDAGPEAICYRADLFEKAGLPSDREEVAALMSTWDDYFALGEKFTKASPDVAWYDASGSIAQAMLNQIEFPFEQEDGTVDVDNAELKEVWETVTSRSDSLSTQTAQWSDDWNAGFARDGFATIPCPGWMRNPIKDNTGDPAPDGVVWDIADVFPGGGGNWGGSYLAVPQTSKKQDAAREFAAWITAPEQQLTIFETLGNFPSQVEALESPDLLSVTDEYFNDAPVGEIFSSRADAIDVQPFHGPLYSDILTKFQDAINRVDQGTDPDESWASFVSEVKALQ